MLATAPRRLLLALACVLIAVGAPPALGQDAPVVTVPAGDDGGPSVTPAPDPAPSPDPDPAPGAGTNPPSGGSGDSGGGSNPAPAQPTSSGSSTGSSSSSSTEAEKPDKAKPDKGKTKNEKEKKKKKKKKKEKQDEQAPALVADQETDTPPPNTASLPFAGGSGETQPPDAPGDELPEVELAKTREEGQVAAPAANVLARPETAADSLISPALVALIGLAVLVLTMALLPWSARPGSLGAVIVPRRLEILLIGVAMLGAAAIGLLVVISMA